MREREWKDRNNKINDIIEIVVVVGGIKYRSMWEVIILYEYDEILVFISDLGSDDWKCVC